MTACRSTLTAIGLTLAVGQAASAQGRLSDAAVTAAIVAGQSNKANQLVSECVATAGLVEALAAETREGIRLTGAFGVTVTGSEGRIAFLAAEARRLYKPFTIAQVPSALRERAVFVMAEPNDPDQSRDVARVAAPIERIVLKSKSSGTVAQPVSFETQPVEWKNPAGKSIRGTRASARFDRASVEELPAGEFDVVIVTTAGERRCKVGAKDRQRIFPSIR